MPHPQSIQERLHWVEGCLPVEVVQDGFLIQDAVRGVTLTNVNFDGPLTNPTNSLDDIAAIRWASTASLVCTQVNISGGSIEGWTWATNTAQQIKGATISNCQFYNLYQGIVLGGASPVNGGPTGVAILSNTFDHIYHEGVVISNVALNSTGFNIFFDVGNEYNGFRS